MKAKLPWKSTSKVYIWNTLELLHLCYYLKQQTVHLSAIPNATLGDISHVFAAQLKGGQEEGRCVCKGVVANADSGLKIWP